MLPVGVSAPGACSVITSLSLQVFVYNIAFGIIT